MTRDLRDPQLLGETILGLRKGKKRKLSSLVDENTQAMMLVASYQDGDFMSNDPADHHSKTPQTAPVPWSGGE